jgi:hypothetical protein
VATVPDVLAAAIRRSTPASPPTAVLGVLLSVEIVRDAAGTAIGASAVTVDIGGTMFNVNGVEAAFNRAIGMGIYAGQVVLCNIISGQLIVSDVVIPMGV